MRLISAIGTGLLVGTALIVIIPEGIETLYSAESITDVGGNAQAAMHGGAAALSLHKASIATPEEQVADPREFIQFVNPVAARSAHLALRSLQPRAEPEESHNHSESSSHAWIGVALITGFILMYLIDALSQPSPSAIHIPRANLSSPTASSPSAHAPAPQSTKSTTIGLIIHAFADGIALGASTATSSTQSSSSSSSSSLGLVVFVAILVHKAPAAFGLTAVLLKQGLSKRATRGHLLLFSLAAPVGALVTWAFVKILGTSGVAAGSAAGSGTWWTGVVLVFSGGTFL
jgi:zinc transporter 9